MNASDKAHLREAARRGECTPDYAEQLIREAEQANSAGLPAHAPGRFDDTKAFATDTTQP